MQCLEFADSTKPDADLDDKYWRTEQLLHCFNDHYANIVTHGTYLNVDKRIFELCKGSTRWYQSLWKKTKGYWSRV